MTEKEHHLYGGSSVKYWSNCYGWASLIQALPVEPPGKAAKRGTALHTGVLEVKTQGEINKLLFGEEPNFLYDSISDWPEEGQELADEFWEFLWKEILEEFITGKTIYIEKKLMLFEDLDAGGTADFIALWYNDKGKLTAALGDCKFGRVKINPDDEQLKFYLAALSKLVRNKGKEIEEFISFVYQPESYGKFHKHKFTKSEIVKAEQKYEKAILESKKEKPKFKAGDWCEYCKARGNCPTYTKHVDKQMELMVLRTQETVQFAQVETLSDEIIAKVVLHGDKLVNQIEAIKKEAFIRMIGGHKIPGLKFVATSGRRSLKDSAETVNGLIELGIEPYQQKLIGIGEAKKRIKEVGSLKGKEIDKFLDSISEKSEPPPKITSADDPRPEIQIRNPSDLLIGLDESEDSEF